MAVPEAAIRKYHSPMFRKHHVGLARQVPCVQAKAKAFAMQPLAQNHFGLCVTPLDTRHHPAADSGRYGISHGPPFSVLHSQLHRPSSAQGMA